MDNKAHKRKTMKPKNRFTICCFCVGSSTSDVDLNAQFRNDESYDYVVEKLAIKKVPISLFATEEDLAEIEQINSSSIVGDYKVTSKDKKSATIFSSYYSKIPKHAKKSDISTESSKLNGDTNRNALQDNNVQISKMGVMHKTENYQNHDISNDVIENDLVVSAESHKELNETKKFRRITPELQETLHELGSKPRPTGSPSIKHRTVSRSSNESNVVNIDKNIFDQKQAVRFLENEIPQTETLHQKILKRIFPSKDVVPVEESSAKMPEIESTNDQMESADINSLLSSLAAKAGATQKWKIIIKEHGDGEAKDSPSTDNSTDGYTSGSETFISETE